jgi:YbbR domain-containing protein
VFRFIIRLFTKNIGLKIVSLMLALVLWFYVGKEIARESEGERSFLKRIFPSEGVTAKKLKIVPVIEGNPRRGFEVDAEKATLIPSYCIAVGTKDLLEKIDIVPTAPINVDGASKPFTRSVPLKSIPGVYMEETAARVTVSIQPKAKSEE